MVVFHDLVSPHVAKGLRALDGSGWNVMAYQTAQIVGVAWRGRLSPSRTSRTRASAGAFPSTCRDITISGVEPNGAD